MVAPTSTMVPSSITGRNRSCCARLKRWISSTNSSVPCPVSRRARAASNTFLRSATPEKIAEICSKCSSVASASSRATVVLPVPGGPQNTSEPSVRVVQHARQRAVGAEQMVLADDLGELVGPQLVGQRPRRVAVEARRREQARAAAALARAVLIRSNTTRNICWPPRLMVIRQSRLACAVDALEVAGLARSSGC